MRAGVACWTLESYPLNKILDILDNLGRLWAEPDYPPRKKALEYMPSVAGFHPTMVELALRAMRDALSRENLEKKIRQEIGEKEYLDRFTFSSSFGGYLRTHPLGIVLHVSAGNVFIGGIDSLIHGFLTKNVNLLKLSSADPLFPLLFARSLQEVDDDGVLSRSYAMLSFSSKDRHIEEELKKRCDAIVVWGGEEAVRSYREGLPVGTRLVEYGPKYSVSILTFAGLVDSDLDEVARRVALDVSVWEQRACSSPQVLYLEEKKGSRLGGRFVGHLIRALEKVALELPQGDLSTDEKVELLKARELARVAEVLGEARVFYPRGRTDFTVIWEKSLDFRPSPLNRCLYLKSYSDWEEVLESLRPLGPYLQTVGLLAGTEEMERCCRDIASLGFSRITQVGKMWEDKPGSPHDGSYQIERLIRWTAIESVRERFERPEGLVPAERGSPEWERTRDLLSFVRERSPFYRERLQGAKIQDLEDFERAVPLLEKHHIYEHTPPQGEGILTGPLERSYVFASGGSTGAPKFTFYTYDEFDRVTTVLSEIYQIAGISTDDVVGNLFMAGNLWTSFLVANEALEKLGCVTLPIAGNADIELIIRYIKLFSPTALLGLPSILILLAQALEKEKGKRILIQKILYGGEHLSEEGRAYLRETLGTETILSAGYASVDAGPIGFQCQYCARTIHHLLSDDQYLEIVDPYTGKIIKSDRPGEIVVTNLRRRLMPIIRYRTGDMGKMIFGTCACGNTSQLFELLGRCDDVVRVGSVSIYPDELERILAELPEASHLFQLVIERIDLKDRLVIRVEVKTEDADGERISRALRELLLKRNAELAEALREGWLGSLEVEMCAPGGLPRIRRTGKIKKVIDMRGR